MNNIERLEYIETQVKTYYAAIRRLEEERVKLQEENRTPVQKMERDVDSATLNEYDERRML